MKILLVLMASFFIPSLAFAREGQKELKPLYALPKVVPEKSSSSSRNTIGNDLNKPLLATESGIYRVINTRTILPLWTEGKAKQILKIENIDNSGKGSDEFFFVTS